MYARECPFEALGLNILDNLTNTFGGVKDVVQLGLSYKAIGNDHRSGCDSGENESFCWNFEKYTYHPVGMETSNCALHTAISLLKYGNDAELVWGSRITMPSASQKLYVDCAKTIIDKIRQEKKNPSTQ